ncbi:MAG: 7TM diverse intracellular signaling domain-containing protein [Bacteroidota bacterium]|nr:7TM diverse intracellular signaling domain-containing protein [Bacteroidota bacterium]
MNKLRLFLSLCLFSFASTYAQKPIEVNADDRVFIGKNIEYFVDTTRKLNITDVMSKTYLIGQTDIPNFGNIPHNVWMRFSVQSKSEKELFLEVMAPLINELEVYEVSDSNTKKLFSGGHTHPFYEKQVASDYWLVNLNVKENIPTVFYIKGQSVYPFQIPITVSSKNKYVEHNQNHNLFWGIYMGIMIFAFVYNLFIFFSVRERTYLYYILYILGSATFYLGLQGYDYEFIWPNNGELNNYLPVVLCFTNTIITLFTLRFLQITKQHKFQFYSGRIVIGLFGLVAILNLAGVYEAAIGLAQMFSLVAALYFITAGLLSLKRGVPTAKYYLIGWSTFLILVIVFILTLNNVIPSNFFTTHCLFIGHMTEVLLLSFALADRINWLKKENENNQKEIIDQQQKANFLLEQKVKERTAELVENQGKLIESEKLATFGILASRMSHEIQNPLNFVNNFSDISTELVDEIALHGNEKEKKDAVELLKNNLQKINHHGKRASEIIKQLQEQASSGTVHEFTDFSDKG